MIADLTIAGIYETEKLLAERPNFYRVVSISSPLDPISQLQGAKEAVYLYFDDILQESVRKIVELRMATREDCQLALNFLDRGGPRLVHCHHGKSRSTAIALGYLLKEHRCWQSAVEEVLRLRPWATPNEYVVQTMCEIIGMETQYPFILEYLAEKRKEYLRSRFNVNTGE